MNDVLNDRNKTRSSYTNQNNELVATQEVVTITYGKGEKTFLG